MKSIRQELNQRILEAMCQAGLEGDPVVRPSQDEKFGDYQSNGAMAIAKKLGENPRDTATSIVEQLNIEHMCEPPEIAGPGFINFRLLPEYLASQLQETPGSAQPLGDRLGLPVASEPEAAVVDFSSPNLAKEMHVGHLRSTVIGECIARILEFQGHIVHRENHVGDWGTQFGMLLAHLRQVRPEVLKNPDKLVIRDLEAFYVEAKTHFDADEAFRNEARETVVALQSGEPNTYSLWKAFCDESLRHCHAIYDRLGVQLVDRGESFYTDGMVEVIERLKAIQKRDGDEFVRESDGALCLFMEGFKNREGEPLPFMVRKSDGGFNYATSDLATLLHRVERLKAKRLIYVVGLPQKQHFQMLFAAVRQAKFVDDDVILEHLGFGSMLASTGKPFKTREGQTVKLKQLLDSAVDRAREVVKSQVTTGERSIPPEQMENIAETVGLAAVKYFDLSHALTGDYRFDLESMTALEGNTAPYLLYAYARIRSIERKAGVDFSTLDSDCAIRLEHPAELSLTKKLIQFPDIVETLERELKPNLLTEYLYELSKVFSRFYDKNLGVRVIDATPQSTRLSRLRLCDLTARTLRIGLNLLGIETLEQM